MSNITARNWLADRKLAIRGARGKFSKEALAALNKAISEGVTFADWDKNGRIKPQHVARVSKKAVVAKAVASPVKVEAPEAPRKVYRVKPIEQQLPFVRTQNAMSVMDDRGTIINIGQCSQGHAIRRCTCSKIEPPKWMGAVDFELITV